jgi:hypothetical protein
MSSLIFLFYCICEECAMVKKQQHFDCGFFTPINKVEMAIIVEKDFVRLNEGLKKS